MNLLKNQQAAELVDSSYIDLESMLMQNIVRHLKGYEQPIDSTRWQLQKLAEIGKLNKENMQIIAKMSGISHMAAERMLQEMAEEAIQAIDPGLQEMAEQNLAGGAIAVSKSKNVKQVMKSLKKQSKDTLNKCNTTMLYKAQDAYKGLVTNIIKTAGEIENKQEFINILNKNAIAVTAGAESRSQAMIKCIREFNDKGIPAFVDKKGRNWTPEAYVNMAMRNTARSTADEVQTARCMDAGVNLIAIDSHSGARPKCAKDQGKIFSLDNTSGETVDAKGRKIKFYPWNSSSYGDPDGILGINCGHDKHPFVPGVNIQRYFPTEDMDANNKLYKETQVQRALERDVRKQKRECMLFDELGETEAFEKSAVKLKQKEARLKSYVDSKEHLHRRKDREQVVGFDKGVSARAVAGNKKAQKALAEKAKNDKIKVEIKDAGIKGEVNLKPDKIDVSGFAFDDKHINAERNHKVTREDAERFIREADISLTRWNGRFINYYGPNGAAYVDVRENKIRTAYRKEEFDEKVKKLREVMKKNE